jgi:hypothetical protein
VNYNAPWFGHRSVFEWMLRESEQHVEEWNDAWSQNGGDGMGNSEMISTILGADRGEQVTQVRGGRLPRSVWAYQENDPWTMIQSVREGAWFVTGIKTRTMYDMLIEAHEGAP